MVLHPFDETGVERDAAGIKHYVDLPDSVVAMLRTSVDRDPSGEAVVEVDGPRLTFRELWDAAARVAGGLRAGGVGRGDRVAIRLGNGVDWVLAFLGTLMAGGVAVPVNTRFTDPEAQYVIDDSGAGWCWRPVRRCRTAPRTRRRGCGGRTSRRSSTRRGTTGSRRGR